MPTPTRPGSRSADWRRRGPWRRLGTLALVVAAAVSAWTFRSPSLGGLGLPGWTVTGPFGVKPVPPAPRRADFGSERPTADVRHVAHWAVDSRDHGHQAFVIVDKADARVWVFDAGGRVVGVTPALVGAAVGDDPVPGIGEKPLAEVLPHEKTTPAGRYIAEPGHNANGEDVVWVSYDLAVSMHRVRPLVAAERRLERLASPGADDNRISFGCINLPVAFYEHVVRPTVLLSGAVVYVLPETRSPQEQFGSYDVDDPAQMAVLHRATAVK